MASHGFVLERVVASISKTEPKELCSQLPSLLKELSSCQQDFLAPKSTSSLLLHELKTRISTLLAARDTASIWIGVVVAKHVIEIGGWESLNQSGTWIKSMILNLKKSMPTKLKILALVTLTKIFNLIAKFPTLAGELLTPNLQPYILTCLGQVSEVVDDNPRVRRPKMSNPFLTPVIKSFTILLPQHGTIFRPFREQIDSLLKYCIVDSQWTKRDILLQSAAQRLFALLHICAPKDAHSQYWLDSFQLIINQIHSTSTHVFRSVKEEWNPMSGLELPRILPTHFASIVGKYDRQYLQLSSWQGMSCGIDRIVDLLHTLEFFLLSKTSLSVSVPLGSLIDLLTRHWQILCPSETHTKQEHFNMDVSREERDSMYSGIARIHVAGLEVLLSILRRFGRTASSLIFRRLRDLAQLFGAEHSFSGIRASVYTLLKEAILLEKVPLSKSSMTTISNVVRRCLQDLEPKGIENSANVAYGSANKNAKGNGFSDSHFFPRNPSDHIFLHDNANPEAETAAEELLAVILLSLDPVEVHPTLRSLMDRAAVLSNNKDAMLSSVLNHSSSNEHVDHHTASILPHLVRTHGDCVEVEASIRPQLPIIWRSYESEIDLDGNMDDLLNSEHGSLPEGYRDFEDSQIAPDQNDPFENTRDSRFEAVDVSEDQNPTERAKKRHNDTIAGLFSEVDEGPGKRVKIAHNSEISKGQLEEEGTQLTDLGRGQTQAKSLASQAQSNGGDDESDLEITIGPALSRFIAKNGITEGDSDDSDSEVNSPNVDQETSQEEGKRF